MSPKSSLHRAAVPVAERHGLRLPLLTIPAPEVANLGPSDDIASIVARVAWNIRNGYQIGGSSVTAAIQDLLASIDTTLRDRKDGIHQFPFTVTETVTVRLPGLAAAADYSEFLTRESPSAHLVVNRYHQRALLELLDSVAESLMLDGGYWTPSERADLRIDDRARAYFGDFGRYEETVIADGGMGLARLPHMEAIASFGCLSGQPDYTGWRFERLAFPGERRHP